eukprot:227619-Pelagomonas_calceolata.AAC.1
MSVVQVSGQALEQRPPVSGYPPASSALHLEQPLRHRQLPNSLLRRRAASMQTIQSLSRVTLLIQES